MRDWMLVQLGPNGSGSGSERASPDPDPKRFKVKVRFKDLYPRNLQISKFSP